MRLIEDDTLGIITVYQEAEGESYFGKVLVAEVIIRRTKRKFMSDGTVTGTVLRRLQFSGMNENTKNRIRSFKIDTDDQIVQDCMRAWTEAKAGSNHIPGVMHFYNPTYSNPSWAQGAKIVLDEGNHRFIIPKEG